MGTIGGTASGVGARRIRSLPAMLAAVLTAAVTTVALVAVGPAAGVAQAEPGVEMLMVPSPAMGRDIPVAFSGGGPHAVYLLDAFDAAPQVSNWVTAGNAMGTLAGQGISVVAPAGGAYSMYTDWEADGSKQWNTFLATELPNWLAANKGLAPNGHAAVGAAMGGYGAMALAAFHPDRFRYAGAFSAPLTPELTGTDGAITDGLARFGGVDIRNMWGLPQLGRWKWRSPNVHVQLLVDNNTRLWVYSPMSGVAPNPAAVAGYPQIWQGNNRSFYAHYRRIGGSNAHFDFPPGGEHGWGSWSAQLAAMRGDLVTAIR